MHRLLFRLLFISMVLAFSAFSSLFSENHPLSLQEERSIKNLRSILTYAEKGDFIVAESGKILSLISIRSIDSKTLIIEEISAPMKNITPRPKSWAEWVKNKAPGHSSWSILEIDLEDSSNPKCYSFSRGSYIQVTQKESLFATLLQVPLHPLPTDQRKRIGPPPNSGETDFRKLWQPSFIFEGELKENSDFFVFKAIWPKDGSELEEKEMILYFDKELRIALPLWIQIETSHAIGHFRTIDCGKNLKSPLQKKLI